MGLLDYAMIALWVEEQLWSWKGISLQITHTPVNSQHILDSQLKTSSHALMAQLSAHRWTTCTTQLSRAAGCKQSPSQSAAVQQATDVGLSISLLSHGLKIAKHR